MAGLPGAINNVKLYYSINGGIVGLGTYPETNLIGTFPALPATLTWNVPDKIGTNLRIRVSDANNSNVWVESANPFRIKGRVQLDVPETPGISWPVGTTQLIKWTPTGTYSNVEIHYATDGNFAGLNVFPIAPLSIVLNSASGIQGQASWLIPDKIGSLVKARAWDAGNTDVEDISTNAFKIVGVLDVTAPESGQIWYVGETNRVITWDATGTITNVKIEYKTSAAGAYTTIVANHPGHTTGANSYTWNVWDTGVGVADERTEAAYIRVSDANFPEVANVSAAPFSIRPKITVDSPIAGQRLGVASNNANLIKWTRVGTKTTTVDIRYDTNDGKGADGIAGNADDYPVLTNTIASAVDASLGSTGVSWNLIPDTISNLVKIKVVDPLSANEVVYGVSPAFKITGTLNLTDPPVNTVLKVGQDYLIKWTKTGSFTNVNLWYSTDGGLNFNYLINASTPTGTLQYLWTAIGNTPSANVIVRVADVNDPETKALSGRVYIQPTLNITQPESGEVLGVGDSYNIIWTTSGTAANVRLDYATNGGGAGGNWVTIPGAANLINSGTFAWTIPNAISNTVKVRVVDLADTSNWNESLNNFKIRANIAVLSPNGNADPNLTEKWTVGDTANKIKWSINGTVATVKLMSSVDGGVWTQIPGATLIDATTGAVGWTWTIPDSISSAVKVRVVNEGDSTNYDDSNYNFSIQGKLDFSPQLPAAGDETWYVNDPKTIAWVKTGTIPNVRLEYTTNGTTYNPISGAESLIGLSFVWPVSDAIATTVSLRASNVDAAKPTIPALSNNFALKGKLTLNAPLAVDKWQVDSIQNILWTPTGTMGTVN